ncbi:MAG TPA: nucleoside triphosphate pyrophosphohydrolase [Rectinemataceae bacterium]|nr:nucleoside triphosphate pyrophosphohydrolase [Rectinemataceae bacterium]
MHTNPFPEGQVPAADAALANDAALATDGAPATDTKPKAAPKASSAPDPATGEEAAGRAFAELYRIVARLRAPDGCPWDREQSPESLRGSLIEECYELVEAIDEADPPHIAEEAGDIFLLATMISYMHEERGSFAVSEALAGISEKLVRRHPHVFGDVVAKDSAEVLRQWGEIKEKVEGRRKKDSILDGVPASFPPLERAYKLQKKAAKVGFDWPRSADVWAKAREELHEAEAACEEAASRGDRSALEDELGDLLFSAINVARFLDIDPALALRRSLAKFERRFRHVERRMAEAGRPLDKTAEAAATPEEAARRLAEMDRYWDEAKRDERA